MLSCCPVLRPSALSKMRFVLVLLSLVLFRFASFYFVSFDTLYPFDLSVSFRFSSVRFVSFLFVSFRFVSFYTLHPFIWFISFRFLFDSVRFISSCMVLT